MMRPLMRSEREVVDCLNAAPAVAAVRAVAAEQGIPAYLVGGAVRDLFLHRPPRDFDFVVAGDAREFARAILRRATAGGRISAAESGTVAYRSGALGRVDLMPSNGLSVDDFVARHADVTVNTLVFDVQGGRIVDAHGALGDLASRSIRAIPPGAFTTRPAHLPLRAVRMALLTPAFTLDAGTRAELGACGRLVAAAPPGDVGYELCLILKSSECARGICMLDELGLLDVVLDAWLSSVATLTPDAGRPRGATDVEDIIRTFTALDEVIAPCDGPAQKLIPLARHALLLVATMRRHRLASTAADELRLVTDCGDQIERSLNVLAARFSSPGVYGFRVRMITTRFLAGRAAIAAGAPVHEAIEQAIRTLGPQKGWLSAALIGAAWAVEAGPGRIAAERAAHVNAALRGHAAVRRQERPS
jgi:hypothetical protein